jgi:hypothetical protein
LYFLSLYVEGLLEDQAQAFEQEVSTLVKSHDGRYQRRSIKLLSALLRLYEQRGCFNFVQIQCVGKLQGTLLEVGVDRIFDIVDC